MGAEDKVGAVQLSARLRGVSPPVTRRILITEQAPYLGWTRLPADLTEFEITHFFSLRPEERTAVLTRYRESLRLGAALQIGFLKMCGRPLDAVQRVPADLLKHLGEQIEVPAPTIATLRALYLKRRRTLYEHQRWAMGFRGLIRFEPTDTDKLLPALCDVVRAGVSGDQLLTATRKLGAGGNVGFGSRVDGDD
jgi:hypothetical protein